MRCEVGVIPAPRRGFTARMAAVLTVAPRIERAISPAKSSRSVSYHHPSFQQSKVPRQGLRSRPNLSSKIEVEACYNTP